MKRHEIIFGVIRVPLDFMIILGSFFAAKQIRLFIDLAPGLKLPIQTIDNYSLLYFAIFGALLYVIVLSLHSLYFIKITGSKIKEFLEIIRYSFYSLMFFLVTIYLGKGIIYQVEIPRLIIIYAFIIGTISVILERIILNNIEYYLLKIGYLRKKRLLIINNKNLKDIKEVLEDIKKSKIYKIIGYANLKNKEIEGLKFIGSLNKIQKLFENKKCDEVLYIDSDYGKKDLKSLWELTRIFGIRYRYITNSFDITKTNTTLSLINNIPVIEIKNTPLDNWGKVIKRIFDIFVGIIGIIILIPIFIVISILIKIEDPKGPVIYKNKRIGQKGKIFTLYKFRYIKWEHCIKDAYNVEAKYDKALLFEQELIKHSSTRNGPLYKINNDPRKTKVGNWIEKYSIDELPQFFNLIIGNMSLVGPRPHQPREVEKYSLDERRVLTIKPGITGMAQVNGRESNDFKKETALDIFYIENWSLLLDLKIILKTFAVIISRK
ncbi:MAG: exopolysaccharide biosynthesis polyprenyl glycosylphosphotransferase [Candidatus Gracilibacteria bacterium]|nr:exopolysaccharide biosynthesis polyprenyl glycosylphosphotransferase [Candidatus Gracilibacteria bacterium]